MFKLLLKYLLGLIILAIIAVAILYITAKQVSILLGNGDGTFSPGGTLATGNFPVNLKVGDLNNDGHADLVVPNLDDDDVQIFLGNGDGAFTTKGTFPAGTSPEIALIGDLNGDGIPDLFALNPFGYTVLLGNGDGTFSSSKSIAVFLARPRFVVPVLFLTRRPVFSSVRRQM